MSGGIGGGEDSAQEGGVLFLVQSARPSDSAPFGTSEIFGRSFLEALMSARWGP